MIIRYYLKSSVCALMILAIVSFGFIFAISMSLIEIYINQIRVEIPLTMDKM